MFGVGVGVEALKVEVQRAKTSASQCLERAATGLLTRTRLPPTGPLKGALVTRSISPLCICTEERSHLLQRGTACLCGSAPVDRIAIFVLFGHFVSSILKFYSYMFSSFPPCVVVVQRTRCMNNEPQHHSGKYAAKDGGSYTAK